MRTGPFLFVGERQAGCTEWLCVGWEEVHVVIVRNVTSHAGKFPDHSCTRKVRGAVHTHYRGTTEAAVSPN